MSTPQEQQTASSIENGKYNTTERKIYPLTREIMERADEKALQLLEKLSAERLAKRAENMTEQEAKAYCEEISKKDPGMTDFVKMSLKDGDSYKQIAYFLMTN